MSVFLATILIPAWAQKYSSTKRGLRAAIYGMLLFNLFYLFAFVVLYPRLLWNG